MRSHFERRVAAIRTAVAVDGVDQAAANLLELAARWTPDALATQIELAMELAALEGREAVFLDAEDGPNFNAKVISQEFREQIAFLRQKRAKPTKVWTDAMKGDHDRAFVVAGATDMAMIEEFQEAIASAAESWSEKAFAKDFDRIVDKYGWSYNGGREWRIRTIFRTNMRTSYMAGRLQQMRDPDVIRLQPYWQYRHADYRVPMTPRKEHVAWDGLVLMHNDPWWDIHFPPNDWLCTCGVRSLTIDELAELGKTGPDAAPSVVMEPIIDRVTGLPSEKPKGVGYGWDYQPGTLWEQGLVPTALIDEAGGVASTGRHVARIDTPEPIEQLLKESRPFKSDLLPDDLDDEEYVRAFLDPFGAKSGEAVLFEDKAGSLIPISDQMLRDRQGNLKVNKRGRATFMAQLAEAIIDPDEIWIGVSEKKDPVKPDETEMVVERRYVRADKKTGLLAVFEIGRKFWEGVTAYRPTDKRGDSSFRLLDKRRGGKLIWKRKSDKE